MKKITSIIAIVALSIAFSTTASAQAPASASAPTQATIVAPITISNATPMNFGNFATSTVGGTLTLLTDGSRAETGGVKLTTTASITPKAAVFTVGGEASYAYSITLPLTDLELTNTTSTSTTDLKTMSVGSFTRAFTAGSDVTTDGTLTGGTETFYVGALLTVGASQAVGKYENTTGFAVTVNYN